MRLELTIDRLGAQGDGVADTAAGPVYVPFTLPDERIAAEVDGERGRLVSVLQASPARVAPVCRHFGTCGGCALQHLEADGYRSFKRATVIAALASRGIEAEVETLAAIGPGTRRRAVFAATRSGGGVRLGFHSARAADIVEITECPILLPAIARTLPGLPALLMPLLSRRGEARVGVTAADNGLDIDVAGASPDLDAGRRRIAARAAAELGLIRLTLAGEAIYQAGKPIVSFDGVEVVLPPNAFLQPTRPAEAAMSALVGAGVGKARRIVELFAGLGTFTFALARTGKVLAVEGDKALLAALTEAVRAAKGRKAIATLKRDLFREPLAGAEFDGFDAAVLDPPRAGAAAQAEALARSNVPRIVMVSCNPATLARDLRTLIDGGYALCRVVPIDQFLFSPHVEVVAMLERRG